IGARRRIDRERDDAGVAARDPDERIELLYHGRGGSQAVVEDVAIGSDDKRAGGGSDELTGLALEELARRAVARDDASVAVQREYRIRRIVEDRSPRAQRRGRRVDRVAGTR